MLFKKTWIDGKNAYLLQGHYFSSIKAEKHLDFWVHLPVSAVGIACTISFSYYKGDAKAYIPKLLLSFHLSQYLKHAKVRRH